MPEDETDGSCCVPGCRSEIEDRWEIPVCRRCSMRIASRVFNAAARTSAPAPIHQPPPSVVYYLDLGQHIKIGFTTNLQQRLNALRADKDQLLAIEPGGRDVERARHDQFAHERLDRRENFRISDRLTDHVQRIRADYGLPRWASLPTNRVSVRKASEMH